MRDLGARVEARREALGLTQEEIARRARSISLQTVGRIERGESANPEASTLLALAGALETSVSYLLGETDNPAPFPAGRLATGTTGGN